MIQPAPVLPSNAPPLRDGDGVYQGSRVLQEHSGNRQQHDYQIVGGYEQKYSTPLPTENAWPQQQQQQQQPGHTIQPYRTQPQYRQPLTYGQARHARNYYYGDDEARITRQANFLFQRFEDSAAYQKYRGRQQKDDKGSQDQKWPDHLERAFFRGEPVFDGLSRYNS